jgi:hypothetical protein
MRGSGIKSERSPGDWNDYETGECLLPRERGMVLNAGFWPPPAVRTGGRRVLLGGG